MEINITGPRGCGKTTVAVEVAKFLKSHGMPVRVVCSTRFQEREISKLIDEPMCPESLRLPMPVVIIDRHDDKFTRKTFAKSND